MLAVVKKPRIELSIQGENPEELIAWISKKFEVSILSSDKPDSIPIEETDFWKEMQSNRVGNLLAGARLKSGMTQKELAEKLKIDIHESGYFKSLYSKFKTTETKRPGVFVAGTAIAPADIPTTKTRAGFAASLLDMLLSKGTVEKRFPIAEIDNDKCTLCEICITACPFGAIQLDPEGNPLKCDLCGGDPLCVRHCPTRPLEGPADVPPSEQSCLQFNEFHKVGREKIRERKREE